MQGLFETVMVNVTVLPPSAAAAVYVGVSVVALDRLPAPLCVQSIVPLLELAPLTMTVSFAQIVWLPPADAVGCSFTVTVGIALS